MVHEISELTLCDSDIRKKPWFFRKCKSRKMAEELLTNASYGEYIVRRSESQAEQLRKVLNRTYSDDIKWLSSSKSQTLTHFISILESISIKSHTKILHFKIVIKKSVVKFGNRNFKCIEDLLGKGFRLPQYRFHDGAGRSSSRLELLLEECAT